MPSAVIECIVKHRDVQACRACWGLLRERCYLQREKIAWQLWVMLPWGSTSIQIGCVFKLSLSHSSPLCICSLWWEMLISWWLCLFCSRAVTRVLLAAVSVCPGWYTVYLHSGAGFVWLACPDLLRAFICFSLSLILHNNFLERGYNFTATGQVHIKQPWNPVSSCFFARTLKICSVLLWVRFYLYCNILATSAAHLISL